MNARSPGRIPQAGRCAMQIGLRLFLLVFASILGWAMLSGQRTPPQKPGFRDRRSATSHGAEQTTDATIGQNPHRQADPEHIGSISEPGKLTPDIIDSKVLAAALKTPPGERWIKNTDLAMAVAQALRNAGFSKYGIDIEVRRGVVSLDGIVANAQQRMEFEEVASRVEGVTRVVNRMRVADEAARSDVVPDQPTILPASAQEEPKHAHSRPSSVTERDVQLMDLLGPSAPTPERVIKQVTIIGNQSIPEWALRLQIKTKVKTPWLSGGNFD